MTGDILPGLVERLLAAAKDLAEDDTRAIVSYFGLENIDGKIYCQVTAGFNLWVWRAVKSDPDRLLEAEAASPRVVAGRLSQGNNDE